MGSAREVAEQLTKMQRRYIWLAGSFPSLVIVQGRGYRSRKTMYAINEDAGELIVFGYSNPLYFLEARGIFRKLQSPNAYTLTEKGDSLFGKMLIAGDGATLNDEVIEVRRKAAA
jgi:hypothetical protein